MKRIIASILTFLLLFTAVGAYAEPASGTCGDGVTWSLENGVLTIAGSGEVGDYGVTGNDLDVVTTAPWGAYASQVETLVIGDGVTSLGAYAFVGLRALTSIVFGSGLDYAGICCLALCPELTAVTLPEGLTKLDLGAFMYCYALETVTLPASIEYIGQSVFDDTVLTTVNYTGTVEEAEQVQNEDATLSVLTWHCDGGDFVPSLGGEFGDGFTWSFEDGTLTVGGTGTPDFSSSWDAPWYNIRSLITAAVFEDGLTGLGGYLLYYCPALTRVDIPASVTSIDGNCAIGSAAIETVNYAGTTEQAAQVTCDGGRLATLPWTCANGTYQRTVGGTFDGGFAWSVVGSTLTVSGSGSLNVNYYWDSPWYAYEDVITSVVISEGVTSMTGECFKWYDITSVSLPVSLTSISNGNFEYCNDLDTVLYAGSIEQAQAVNCEDITLLMLKWTCSNGDYKREIGGTIGDGLSWSLDDGTLTVTGNGAIPDYGYADAVPWYNYSSAVDRIFIGDGVTSVGNYAFNRIDGLWDISLPATITAIAENAFSPNRHYFDEVTFRGTAAQASRVDCRSTVLKLYPWKCTDENYTHAIGGELGSLTWSIANDVLTIGGTGAIPEFNSNADAPWDDYPYVFSEIVIGSGITAINDNAFCTVGCLTLPATLESVSEYAFLYLSDKTYVAFDGTVAQAEAVDCRCNDLNSLVWHCTDDDLTRAITGTHGDNITWSLKDGTLTLSGTGEMLYRYDDSYYPWYQYRNDIQTLVVGEGITTLTSECFFNYDALTTLYLPSTLVSIDNYAFCDCDHLANILYNGTVAQAQAVECNDVLLSMLTWTCDDGDRVPSIGGDCGVNITWSLVGGALTLSGTGPMYEYSDDDELPWYGYNEYITSVSVGSGVTTLSDYCFANFYALESIDIPSGVTSLGDYCFINCRKLTTVTGMADVTTLGGDCFSSCIALKNITLPAGITGIPSGCFYNCSALESIVIPEGVTEIGSYAFVYCSALETVTLPTTIEVFDNYCFDSTEKLNKVFYAGTLEDAKALDLRNTTLWRVTWQCNDETVSPLGLYGKAGDVNWVLQGDTLTLSGSGAVPDVSYYSDVPWYDFCDEIVNVVVEQGITYLGDQCFRGCTALTNVTLPETGLTALGYGCFRECSSLSQIDLPATITAFGDTCFEYCTALERIAIPSGTTALAGSMFYECTSLSSVTVPDTVTSIGSNCFYHCTELTEINIPVGVTQIDQYTFSGCSKLTTVHYGGTKARAQAIDCSSVELSTAVWECTDGNLNGLEIGGTYGDNITWTLEDGVMTVTGTGTMPNDLFPPWDAYKSLITSVVVEDGITSVGQWAFYDCDNMTEVTLAPSVETLGRCCFGYCDNLETVTLQTETIDAEGEQTVKGLVTLGDECFENCPKLANITLPETVTAIGGSAFYSCRALTQITLPDGLTSLGNTCFANTGLTRIEIPAGVTGIPSYCFSDCSALSSVELPEDLTSVADRAFKNCSALEGIALPDGVGSLGAECFYGCTQLASVELSEDMTSIGNYCFYNCTALASIDLPDDLTALGSDCFDGCTALKSVAIPEGVTSLGGRTFCGCTLLESVTFEGEYLSGIGNYCFADCSALKTIAIPEGVTRLYYDTFYNCTSLNNVSLPSTITGIGSDCFYDCSALDTIRYAGTRKQALNDITCDDDTALYCTWICSDGTLNNLVDPMDSDCGENLTWSLAGGVLTISGEGAMYDYDVDVKEHYAPWYLKREEITTIVVNGGTTMGKCAFYNCPNLTQATFADSVTALGERCFYNCDALTTVTFGSGIKTLGDNCFRDCDGLTTVTFGGALESLGNYCFYDCYDLANITLPEGIKALGESCFVDCDGLTSITLPGTLTSIGSYCFYDCDGLETVIVSEGVTDLSVNCFRYCDTLKNVTLPQTLESLGNACFGDCSSIAAIELPDGLTSLGQNCFYDCNALTAITIPGSVRSIGDECFADCDKLASATVEDGVTSLPYRCFYDCSALATVDIAGSVKTVGEACFNNCVRLNDPILHEGTETLGVAAFEGCSALLEIDLPRSITGIDSRAFNNCSNLAAVNLNGLPAHKATMSIATGNDALMNAQWSFIDPTELILPNALHEIRANAFENVNAQRIVLPEGVTSIGSEAFANCGELLEIVFRGDPESIAADALSGCPDYTVITVPADAPNADNWAVARVAETPKLRKNTAE